MSQTYDARGTDRSITVRPSQAGLGMVECCHIHIVMLLFLIQAKQILRWRNTHTDTHGSRCQAACGRAAAAAAFSPSTRGAWGKKRYKKKQRAVAGEGVDRPVPGLATPCERQNKKTRGRKRKTNNNVLECFHLSAQARDDTTQRRETPVRVAHKFSHPIATSAKIC